MVGRTLAIGPAATVLVERPIGEGGFATIYRARDLATGEAVALKHVRLAGDPDAAADCRNEVAVMWALRGHPHILTLRAATGGGVDAVISPPGGGGDSGGGHAGSVAPSAAALVPAAGEPAASATPPPPPPPADEALLLMDMCTESLGDCLRAASAAAVADAAAAAASAPGAATQHPPTTALPPSTAAAVFRDVCRGVAAMHAARPPLFHRDIKAENVLLHASGRWVLCDFGSATSWAGVHQGTDSIMMAEDEVRRRTTPAYRAPELFDLYTRERLDGRVDVWALGVLLYLLASGRLPFTSGADTNKLAVLSGRFPPLPPGVPPAMAALVGDLLAVSPADRPAIDAVLARVEALAADLADGDVGGGNDVRAGTPVSAVAAGAVAAAPTARPAMTRALEAGHVTPAADTMAATSASPIRRLRSKPTGGFAAFTDDDDRSGRGGGGGGGGGEAGASPARPGGGAGIFWARHGEAGTPDRCGSTTKQAAAAAATPPPSSPPPPLAPAVAAATPATATTGVATPLPPPPLPPQPAVRSEEVESLRRQLADALARNAALAETVRAQEATIRQLRVAAHDDGAAVAASGTAMGWATFGGEGDGEAAAADAGGAAVSAFAAGAGLPLVDAERAASEPTPVESWRL